MYFDRIDICEAYRVLETDYNVNGLIPERGKSESIGVQLSRLEFVSDFVWDYDSLSDNGKDIYDNAVERLGLPVLAHVENVWMPLKIQKRSNPRGIR